MTSCKHEIDELTIEHSKKYGRVGRCLKCGCKMFATTIITESKRGRPHMSKKQRRKNRGKK